MKQLQQMMQKAQAIQGKMADAQQELENLEVVGLSGGGLIQVTFSGKGDLKTCSIDPSLLKAEEKEVLEDLVVAAVRDGKTKADELSAEKMGSITQDISLPGGMQFPF